MYTDTLYGGFYTVTGKCKKYIHVAGTDEKDNVVSGKVPKSEFYKNFMEVEG
ncbi:hypothetical protein [Macrococcoides bohemicum]|uniref:hypothetical protein n=1 Tax=Macrococcoides bohemicum TaxID=1903056 RepID=UPI00140538E0|nr:hypothetical protein [Macrococcus bohemicus]